MLRNSRRMTVAAPGAKAIPAIRAITAIAAIATTTAITALAGGTAPATAAATTGYKVGDTVECDPSQTGTAFRTGRITAIQERAGWPDPFYIVIFPDSPDAMKCVVRGMRPASAAAQADAGKPGAGSLASLCRPGARVEAAWGISWYAATVKGAPDASGKCPVHLDGYPDLYDLMAGEHGLRPRGSGPVMAPSGQTVIAKAEPSGTEAAKPAAPATAGVPPDGTYPCHKMSPGAALMQVGAVDVRGGKATFRGGLPDGWTLRAIRYQGSDGRGQPRVTVDYRSKAGFDDRLDCVRG